MIYQLQIWFYLKNLQSRNLNALRGTGHYTEQQKFIGGFLIFSLNHFFFFLLQPQKEW